MRHEAIAVLESGPRRRWMSEAGMGQQKVAGVTRREFLEQGRRSHGLLFR